MTGCYAKRVSMPDVLSPVKATGLSHEEKTIAELLKPHGDATMCKEQLLMERRLRGASCANSHLRVAAQRGYRLGIGRVLKPNDNLDASLGVLTDPSNQLIARARNADAVRKIDGPSKKSSAHRGKSLCFEILEPRTMLSASSPPLSTAASGLTTNVAPSPAQVQPGEIPSVAAGRHGRGQPWHEYQ